MKEVDSEMIAPVIISKKVIIVSQKLGDIDSLIFSLKRIMDEITIPHPMLLYEDIKLAVRWTSFNFKLEKIEDVAKLVEKFGSNNELGRVLSARAAEKAAIKFYKKINKRVKDISILQLSSKEHSEWRDYDIQIENSHFIDVKNSRRSQSSRDRYVEHCVPKIKIARSENDEVHIAGLLSPYLYTSDLIGSGPTINANPLANCYSDTNFKKKDPIIFLGETSATKHAFLLSKFQSESFQMINFQSRSSNISFLPPWVYDLPPKIYKNRDTILEKLNRTEKLAKLLKTSTFKMNIYPFLIRFNMCDNADFEIDKLEYAEKEFLFYLIDGVKNACISLPYIFLSILKHFLGCIQKENYGFNPRYYSKFIYFEKKETFPFFICDPLNIIGGLINSLSILWDRQIREVAKFNQFRLSGFNILQGKANNELQWKTIIAFCGGRKLSDKSKCGKNPLVLGQSKLCPECGKLICPVCEFCKKGCTLYSKRIKADSQ